MAVASISVNIKENGRHSPTWNLNSNMSEEATLAELLAFTKRSLIVIANDVLHEEQGKGFDKNPITLVDGKHNVPTDRVSPLGKIQFVSRQNLKEVILYAYEAVWYRSPRGAKGEYVTSNVVTHNGKTVAKDLGSLKIWLERAEFSDRDKIRIVNTAPYARKLELSGVRFGVTKRKWGKATKKGWGSPNAQGMVKKPNGAYTLATKAIKAKYGKAAFIKYETVLGSQLGLVGKGRVRKTGRDIGRPYVYPTILIYAFTASGPERGGMLQ